MAHYRGRVIRYEGITSTEEADKSLSEVIAQSQSANVQERINRVGREVVATEQISQRVTVEAPEDGDNLVEKFLSLKIVKQEVKDVSSTMAVVTWNMGKLSVRGKNVATKLDHLTRLGKEVKGLAIVAVQEVMQRAAVEALAARLCQATGSNGWVVLCPKHCLRRKGATFNALVYDSMLVKCLAFGGVDGDEFWRRPQFGLFRKMGKDDEIFGIINVHIRQQSPTEELIKLPAVLAAVRESVRSHFGVETSMENLQLIILGDFNKGSGGSEFLLLRRLGMVELVKSKRKEREARASADNVSQSSSPVSSHEDLSCPDVPFLRDCTTSGRKWIDNVWMSWELRREAVIDAAIYRTSGLLRGMTESGYQSAGRLRSQCSDHFPLVVKLGKLPPLKPCLADLSRPGPPAHLGIKLEPRHSSSFRELSSPEEPRTANMVRTRALSL